MSYLKPQTAIGSTSKVSPQPPLNAQHPTSAQNAELPEQNTPASQSSNNPVNLDHTPTGFEVWRGQIGYLLQLHSHPEPRPLYFRAIAVGAPNLNIETCRWPNHLARTAGFKLLPPDVATHLYRSGLSLPFGQMRIDPAHVAEDVHKWDVFQRVILGGWCIFYGFSIDPMGLTHSPVYGAYGILFFSSRQVPGRVLFTAFVNQSCPASLARDGIPAGPRMTGARNSTMSISRTISSIAPQSPILAAGAAVNLDMGTILGLPNAGGAGEVIPSTTPSSGMILEGGARPDEQPLPLGTGITLVTPSPNPVAISPANSLRLGATGVPRLSTSGLPADNLVTVNLAQTRTRVQATREQIRPLIRIALARLGVTRTQLVAATPAQKQVILAQVRQVILRMRAAQRQGTNVTGAGPVVGT